MLQVFMKWGMVHAYSCSFLSIIIVIERGVAQAKEKIKLVASVTIQIPYVSVEFRNRSETLSRLHESFLSPQLFIFYGEK